VCGGGDPQERKEDIKEKYERGRLRKRGGVLKCSQTICVMLKGKWDHGDEGKIIITGRGRKGCRGESYPWEGLSHKTGKGIDLPTSRRYKNVFAEVKLT